MDEKQNNKSESALREEAILQFWKENNVFQKSLEKESPKGKFVFYDGPPFATGLPHYGHILGSTAKDVFGRYKTMQGYNVPRRWGWDCHGLPIENIVEKDLKLSGHKEIENLGIEKFVEHARSKVLTYVHEWKKTVERIGRWVDFDNSYKTMDNSFIESVWWAFSELYKKDLIYEGVRVLAYCPRCETPIANSEIAMDNSYKDIADISVYVKFPLEGEKNTYLLAWTTTPWSLPGDTALAVNKNIKYIKVKCNDEFYIVAEDRVKFIPILKDIELKAGENFSYIDSAEILGKKYTPPFDYYKDINLPNKENIWKIWHADFVNTEQGTGIAHEAPAFGEDDMNLAKANDIPYIIHVTPEGKFSPEVLDFDGMAVKPKSEDEKTRLGADIAILKYLQDHNFFFAKEKIVHSYPHCYRCETPLLYYALPSWFVNIQKPKKDILKASESMNWVPEHLKEGRFKNTMESAPDWTISRNRYWASPLPVWKSASGKVMHVSSLEDLKSKTKKSGNKYFIVRHGEAEHNLKGLASADPDEPVHLTEKGRVQTGEAGEKMKEEKIDLIIASPFVRTRETAEIIREKIGLGESEVFFDERLREMDIGVYNKGKWADYHHDFPKTAENFDKAPEGGESYNTVKGWMMNFLHDIEIKFKNKKILIVTHGGPAWLAMAGASGFDAEQTLDMIRDKEGYHYFGNAEVMQVPFVPFPHNARWELDLHRPYIDSINLIDENGEEYKRIPEVIDCWFESGSMPFAQDHYPFERANWQKENFPADFVAEYIAQTRTWYYYTTVISSVLFGQAPFKNIVTTGTLLAEDGEKMSKSKNNFPDPWILFDKYGVDALRFYLMSGTLMKGDDSNFSEKSVQEISSKIIGRLFNVLAFYELYRDKNLETEENKSENILDVWIMSRFWEVHESFTGFMEKYYVAEAGAMINDLVDDLSTWYLRRSRERIKDGDKDAKYTLYFVLKNLSKMLAPIMPFITEEVWQKLKNPTDAESVHLSVWLESKKEEVNYEIIETMQKVRDVVSLGLKERQKAGIAVRQPLQKLVASGEVLAAEYLELIKEELNVKEAILEPSTSNLETSVKLNTEITPELKEEGDYRELVRAVQDMRKKSGLTPSEVITLSIETDEAGKKLIQKFESDFKKTVLISEIKFASNNGEEIKVDELVFKIKVVK